MRIVINSIDFLFLGDNNYHYRLIVTELSSFMYVCLCHPFSDKKVKKHLSETSGRTSVSEIYSSCSGGETPHCCQCLETVKDFVRSHNKSIVA